MAPPPPVPLLDLAAQHAPLQDALRAAATRVFASETYILGPEVEALELAIAAICGAAHAVGVSSGTDALIAALLAQDVGPGDEIITTPFSFVATASAIARVGATPIFVDIDPRTYAIDVAGVEAAITTKTRAIMPVHLFGQMADMRALLALAGPRGLPIIEDGAQAIGAARDGLRCNEGGALGTLSFFPSKNLGGAGDGGMVLTQNEALAARLRRLRNHGQEPKHHALELGGNFRLDALQAAILREKIPYLPAWTNARRAAADRYRMLFAQLGVDTTSVELAPDMPVSLPQEAPGAHHVYNQFVLRSSRRDSLRAYLATVGIDSAVYYPWPLHRQPAFARLGYAAGQFPHAERAAAECLAIPIHPTLTEPQQARVASAIMAHDTSPNRSIAPRPARAVRSE